MAVMVVTQHRMVVVVMMHRRARERHGRREDGEGPEDEYELLHGWFPDGEQASPKRRNLRHSGDSGQAGFRCGSGFSGSAPSGSATSATFRVMETVS